MKRSRQAGFSMAEVLISIVVLSIGGIGAASMQLIALRTTQQSGFQTTAVQMASELADKMRLYSGTMMSDEENPFLKIDYASYGNEEPAPPNKLCYGKKADCNGSDLARFDIYELEKRLKTMLPGGRIRVCKDSFPWNADTRAYKWACTDSASPTSALVIKLGWRKKNSEENSAADVHGDFQLNPSVVLTVAGLNN
jgi:type IV pilus assembly protein PilV